MSDSPDTLDGDRPADDAPLEQLRADIQAGFDELARGEGREYDAVSGRRLADDIKARGRAKRAVERAATTKD